MNRGIIVISTFPSEESAARIAKQVVGKKKLCACVNITRTRSIYGWKGKLEDQQEFIALFKTTKKSAKMLKTEIASMHPYEVPEIVELKMSDVSESYLSWLAKESSPERVAKNRHNSAK